MEVEAAVMVMGIASRRQVFRIRLALSGRSEGAGEAGLGALKGLSGLDAEPGYPMKRIGILFSRWIVFPLHSSDVEQDRRFQIPRVAQKAGQAAHVVPVHRP